MNPIETATEAAAVLAEIEATGCQFATEETGVHLYAPPAVNLDPVLIDRLHEVLASVAAITEAEAVVRAAEADVR